MPARRDSWSRPSLRHHRGEHLHERMSRVQGRSTEDAGVKIALTGPDPHVEVRNAARRQLEHRNPHLHHVPVEDHADVAATLVRLEEVDDRVAARLLLAVTREAHVHGQRTLGGQESGCLEQHVELTLVVGDSPGVEPPVPHLGLERLALPLVERVGRLDVEMPVGDHGRRRIGVGGRPELADHERMPDPLLHVGLAARGPNEVPHPLSSAANVPGVSRVGADAWDAQQVVELVEPLSGRFSHGRQRLTARLRPTPLREASGNQPEREASSGTDSRSA